MRLRRGELAPGDSFAITAHFAGCEACRSLGSEHLDSHARGLLDRLLRTSADDHPDPETDLANFIAGVLSFDEHERIDAHIGICDRCSIDVDDLRQVAASMRSPD